MKEPNSRAKKEKAALDKANHTKYLKVREKTKQNTSTEEDKIGSTLSLQLQFPIDIASNKIDERNEGSEPNERQE